MRQVGEGTIPDLAVLPEGFPQEDGRRGVAVGDGGDIHDFCIRLIVRYFKQNIVST